MRRSFARMATPSTAALSQRRDMGWRTMIVLWALLASSLLPAQPPTEEASADPPAASSKLPRQLNTRWLPNAVQVHAQVISGGLPQGEAAFAELRSLGVRTVISVDGQRPDVTTAARFGLRYVHLPHGYNGITDQRGKELAKAVRQLDRPIYIHCHHGKHRSPAAASVGCISAGLIASGDGPSVLRLAGTSPHYQGLYQSVQEARPLGAAFLDSFEVAFSESVAVQPLAATMVAIDRTHHHLLEIAAAGWQSPADHPDLEPTHEVLLLREHFTELLRDGRLAQRPPAFRDMLRQSRHAAQHLEDQLRRWQTSAHGDPPPRSLQQFLDGVTVQCKNCHHRFRDPPPGLQHQLDP